MSIRYSTYIMCVCVWGGGGGWKVGEAAHTITGRSLCNTPIFDLVITFLIRSQDFGSNCTSFNAFLTFYLS